MTRLPYVLSRMALASGFFGPQESARRLHRALVLSLLIHGLLLLAWHLPRLKEPARPLMASLKAGLPVSGGIAGGESRRAGQSLAPRDASDQFGRAEVLAVPGKGVSAASAAAGGGNAAGEQSAGVTEGGRAEVLLSGEGLRRYRLALGQVMSRQSAQIARVVEAGIQGRVELALEIRAGRAVAVRLERSSGSPILDGRAREMVWRAAQVVPVPENPGSEAFLVPLVMLFESPD